MRQHLGVQLKKAISFSLLNFGAPLVFFLLYEFAGAKPAIASAIAVSLVQAGLHRVLSIPLSPFYIVATGFTVGFGGIDLLITNPRFFRLEPFAQNFVMGLVFLASLLSRISILRWFAEGLPAAFRPTIGPDMGFYLRKLTLVWAIYFFAKSAVFLYLAFQVDLGHLILLRSLIGGGTLVMMVGGEIIYRKRFLRPKPASRQGPSPGALPHSTRSESDQPTSGYPSDESRCRGQSPRPR